MIELKPCPFCGRIPTVDDCGDNRFFVRCKCGIVQDKLYGQRCDAVRRWNTRRKQPDDPDTNVGDTISRQGAIDAICEHGTDLERRGITVLSVANHKQVTVDVLENLPSAQPVIRGVIDESGRIKFVGQPEPKTGKWINNIYDIPICSQCGYKTPYDRAIDDYEYGNFCPNCGARMEVEK